MDEAWVCVEGSVGRRAWFPRSWARGLRAPPATAAAFPPASGRRYAALSAARALGGSRLGASLLPALSPPASGLPPSLPPAGRSAHLASPPPGSQARFSLPFVNILQQLDSSILDPAARRVVWALGSDGDNRGRSRVLPSVFGRSRALQTKDRKRLL